MTTSLSAPVITLKLVQEERDKALEVIAYQELRIRDLEREKYELECRLAELVGDA